MNWPILKAALVELPPLAARGLAGSLAALGLLVLAVALRSPLAVPRAERPWLLAYGGLNVGAWMGFSTLGLLWLNAGEAAVVAYTMPVWAALLAWPMLGERPTVPRVAALALGLGGVAVLMGGGPVGGLAGKLPGLLLLLAAAFSFALGAVLSKRRPLALHPLTSVVWQVALGTVPILGLSLLIETPEWGAAGLRGWGAVLYMAAVPLSLCYVTWFAALRRLPANAASLGTLATPLIGMAASAAALGEPLGWRQGIAIVLTLSGVVLALRG